MVVIRESSVKTASLDLLPICSSIFVVSGMTRGLTPRLCGATGVRTKFLELGEMIGPPQLKEYPVEPVGVEIIRPSLQ